MQPVESHRIVPTGNDREAIFDVAIAATELYGDRAVIAFARGEVVDRVSV